MGLTRRTFLGQSAALAAGTALATTFPGVATGLAAAGTPRRRGIPEPSGFLVTRWAQDPFALGSYSYLGVGATPDDRRRLREPLGDERTDRVFFAGEATSPGHAACVPGAYRSGEQAAAAVDDEAEDGAPVVVIGAGVSGLATAHLLQKWGYQATVLEGRDRIGGRVHTDHSIGSPLDLGASWIEGIDGNPITALAHQAGVRTAVTHYENETEFASDGTPLTDRQSATMERNFRTMMHEIETPRAQLGRDISLGTAVDRMIVSDGDWTPDEVRGLEYSQNVWLEQEYAADVHDLSLFWWDAGTDFDGPDVLFPDTGYEWLPKMLAHGLDVRLGHTVTGVAWNRDGVTVTTDRGVFSAPQVVVTLPLGVLQSGRVAFSPALPAAKQQAISRLGMGLLDKLWLRFPRVFWDGDLDLLGYVSPIKGHWSEWYSLAKHTGEPILIGFNAAVRAHELEAMSDADVVNDAMGVLRLMYG